MSCSAATAVRRSGSTWPSAATPATKRSKPPGVHDRYAVRLLELQLEWVDDAERALQGSGG